MASERDRELAGLSRLQNGVWTRRQALSTGHTRHTISNRLRRGSWEALYPTVYTLAGAPRTWLLDQTAAVFWAKGVASGRAAGALYELPRCEDPAVELVTPYKVVTPHSGVLIHRTTWLPPEQIVQLRGMPATSIERTLLDLCGILGSRDGGIVLDAALRMELTTLGSLDHCLYRTARRGRNGCGILRRLVQGRNGLRITPQSPLETVILEMLIEDGLPVPELQYKIYDSAGFVARPDFVYPHERLILAGHSKQWHWGEAAESKDLEQHNRLAALGYQILYVTWADATRNRYRTSGLIRRLLSEAA